jgi:hypothetical protein
VAVSGELAAAEDQRSKEFSIDATIPWETLTLKGFRFAGARWKFGHPHPLPSKSDSPDQPRDPHKLSDLLIAQGLTWAYLKGKISFTPETAGTPPRFRSADKFLSIEFGGLDEIHFADAPNVKVLDNGFAGSSGLTRSLTIGILGRGKLEREFRQRDTLAMQIAGDALGSVRYGTGYDYEPGDPLGWIHQQIRTLSLRLALGKSGLELSADGELDDFDPAEFAAHKEKRNSRLKSLHAYALRATMPWALLAAREFSFANRASNF